MALPVEVVNGVFAAKAVPSSELPLPPSESLRTSREFLRDVFLKNFKQAARAKDAAMISRFFKLFPPIGWDEEGLDAYSTFAVDLIHSRAPTSTKTSSPLYYVTALTNLFESICNIVDQHQPVIEKYYGPFKMLRVVEGLMRECDAAVERLLEGWKEERFISKKLSDTAITSFSVTIPPTSGGRASVTVSDDDDAVDAREIDKILNEMSALSLRYAAFRRFIASNFEESSSETPVLPKSGDIKGSPGLHLMDKSACHRHFEALIADCYVPLEIWYLRSTIVKAHRTAIIDASQFSPTSSIPDLVFYLLKSVLIRVINTGSMIAAHDCRRRIMDVLKNDYADVLKQKLDDVYRSSSKAGGITDKEGRLDFIVYLNDLQVSISHLERLIKDIISSELINNNFMVSEKQAVEDEICSLQDFGPKIKATLKSGTDQLFNQLIRPRLRTFLMDTYKDVSYALDDEGYSASEQQNIVRKRFIKNWEDIMQGLKETMADSNYRIVFDLVIDALMRPWEKFAVSLKYTELGAIRFDHDIRSIISYLTANANFGDVREKFQRLQQISTLLNIDKDESLDDFFSSSGINWKLNLADARAIMSLKI